jgi:hypothetical protein
MDGSGQLGMKTCSDGQKGTLKKIYGQKGGQVILWPERILP